VAAIERLGPNWGRRREAGAKLRLPEQEVGWSHSFHIFSVLVGSIKVVGFCFVFFSFNCFDYEKCFQTKIQKSKTKELLKSDMMISRIFFTNC
jgi:hypothetical protein